MNIQRGALNKREAYKKQEELMDAKLKEIGCWEEGLSIKDKIEILNFVQESKPSGKENPRDLMDISANCDEVTNKNNLPDNDHDISSQRSDSSEPVIMYDSFTNKPISMNQSQISSSDEDSEFDGKNESNRTAYTSPEHNNNNILCTESPVMKIINFDVIDKQVEKLNIESNAEESMDSTVSKYSSEIVAERSSSIDKNLFDTSFIHDSAEQKFLMRKNMRSEDPSSVYFRNPKESKEECVKRILALFSDQHRQIIAYQKTLTDFIQWGPPLKLKEFPTRRLRSNTVCNKKRTDVYAFSTSDSESSAEETNSKDSDWVNCKKNSKLNKQQSRVNPKLTENEKCNDNGPVSINYNISKKDVTSDNVTCPDSSTVPPTTTSIKRKTFTLDKRDICQNGQEAKPSSKKQKIDLDDENSIISNSDEDSFEIFPSHVVKRGRRFYNKPPLTFVKESKQLVPEDNTSIPSSSSMSDNIHSVKGNREESKEEIEMIPCPLCQKPFPILKIEVHASDCMVNVADPPLLRSSSEDEVVWLEKQRATG